MEDSDEFVEDAEEDDYDDDYSVGESPSPTPTSTPLPTPAPTAAPTPTPLPVYRTVGLESRSKRISLKDLIDAGMTCLVDSLNLVIGILSEGDEVYFKKTGDFSGTLLPDGQIACGDHICPSLSTFAKYAASELNTKWSRQNGWRLVYCRSQCLYDLRKEYIDNFTEMGTGTSEAADPEEGFSRPLKYRESVTARACAKRIPNMYEEEEDMYDGEVSEDSQGADCTFIPPIVLQDTIQVSKHFLHIS
jgi:hypothetical protein